MNIDKTCFCAYYMIIYMRLHYNGDRNGICQFESGNGQERHICHANGRTFEYQFAVAG